MPIFRCGEKLLYFAHVPKCAGTSIERYLEMRVGQPGLTDQQFIGTPRKKRWSRSSPQHITAKTLESYFPEDFFDASFAVVRHPAQRFLSAFQFQKQRERTIHRHVPPWAWVRYMNSSLFPGHERFDNHFLPQTEIVPKSARVFRLEDGLDPVVAFLDEFIGDSESPRKIGHDNQGHTPPLEPGKLTEMLRSFYGADFERFGYD